ncbi:hypothetical protein E0Z10_g4943 [Xylaria hypoxylon]|uniref:C2H2-type domain-containing protein n=1 Tax=Xylaria hypoxylon TaxID=37992 RepID=A0A4Z0YWM2_9PEZI|nr:hypothetical protein E0Z10_g4943 [Xylaria hypoxylon]
METKPRYFCSDCNEVFKTKKLRTKHAIHAIHMRDRTCIDCCMVFYAPNGLTLHKALNKNHRPQLAAVEPSPSPDTKEAEPKLDHFSTVWWRGSAEVALMERPDYGFAWTSPALTEGFYTLLLSELLDSDRRASEGFPIAGQRSIKSANTKFPRSSVNNTPLCPPEPSASLPRAYAALVIDCEMVELEDHVQDLVSISVVDFLSGRIVLGSLVQPISRVKDWRTRVTGVHPSILRTAKQDPSKTVLQGWPEVREKIFAIADSNTVFVGHALPNDLKILRIATDRVVDSVALTAYAAFGRSVAKFPRRWSLKTACEELMGVEVQMKYCPHDPLEDALATRELIIWCLTHPARLLEWGDTVRVNHEIVVEERRERQRIEALKRAELSRAESGGNY